MNAPARSLELRSPLAPSGPATRRVLHLINGEHYSGAERVQDLLALHLPECGYEAAFACLKEGKFAETRQSRHVPVVVTPMSSRWDLRPVRQLAGYLRRGNYSLLHTHTPRTAIVGALAAAWAGVPLVHHLHSPTSADSTHRLRSALNAGLERLCARRAAAVIAVSQALAGYARRLRWPPSKIHVAHNGVPDQGPLPERAAPQGCWTLGMIALFRPRKGIEVLLKAMARLRDAGLRTRLRAVGGFETEDYRRAVLDLTAQLRLEGDVDWVGFQSDVAGQLPQIDLLALPSLFGEGLPMVVLEAMAGGVPVVASDSEGTPEAVRHGETGLLFPPGDDAALAARLAEVLRGEVDWQALRAAGHRRHAQDFSATSMARRVGRIYDEVLR